MNTVFIYYIDEIYLYNITLSSTVGFRFSFVLNSCFSSKLILEFWPKCFYDFQFRYFTLDYDTKVNSELVRHFTVREVTSGEI